MFKLKYIRVFMSNEILKNDQIYKNKSMDEKQVLWNSREIWNTEVSALIGAAISQKYH